MQTSFTPYHINATEEDLRGNHGLGRYILLPGSDGRAKQIAQHFNQLTVKSHSRGHNLYLGNLTNGDREIDVAVISSGMGCPSMEIILHELFQLGGRRFFRIGTAGSLQPEFVKIGHFVNAQAAVRDESTSLDYAPLSIPAVASLAVNSAVLEAATRLSLATQVHTGLVHCKSSFYAREFGAGPLGQNHHQFMDLLKHHGVLATEMETSALFIQTQHYHHLLKLRDTKNVESVLSGAILAVLALPPHQFATVDEEPTIIQNLIQLGLETIKVLAEIEMPAPVKKQEFA